MNTTQVIDPSVRPQHENRFGEKGSSRTFMSKLSRGLMLPIALLPIAGLMLGLGAGTINIMNTMGMSIDANPGWYFLPTLVQLTGDIIFGSLPILFAIAIAIAFTDDSGVAGLSATVAWLVFNATQAVFITENYNVDGALMSYDILWYFNVPTSVVGANVGIQSMVTSVFGGITIGWATAWIYNKYHQLKLPTVIGFFGGTRSVPIISFFMGIFMAFIFLMIWPVIGIGLDYFGSWVATLPAEVDAFIFGVVERALIPFGLHHAFYTPLWYTSVGGSMYLVDAASAGGVVTSATLVAQGNQGIWFELIGTPGFNFNETFGYMGYGAEVVTLGSDSVIQGSYTLVDMDSSGTLTTGDFLITEGVNPGAYMQGKYPFMIFGLPAAGAAMIYAAPKENRQVASSIIISAVATSFLTGITEPIEFTFLFLAPFLYYGFHIWIAGFSFWGMALLGANVGMTFSGGIIDLTLYGFINDAAGLGVDSYWAIALGLAMIPIYYFFFHWYIVKFNVATPGREGSTNKLISKADYNAAKHGTSSAVAKGGSREERVKAVLAELGGLDNLTSVDACITRLRLVVKDPAKVNTANLQKLGAAGVVKANKSIQVIFGAEADILKSEIKAMR